MILDVVFFRTEPGNEPMRDWLKELTRDDRRCVGCDIQIVQFRWPLGMPLVRKMDKALWEVRSRLADGCISRVFFTVDNNEMVLLHGIVKKSRTTPKTDLNIAKTRRDEWFRA